MAESVTYGYRVPGGERIVVRLAAPEIAPILTSFYSAHRDDEDGPEGGTADLSLSRQDGIYLLEGRDGSWRYSVPGEVIVDYESALAALLLERMPAHVRLHAAALHSRHRRILLLGPSGAGKSTLALGLHLRGLRALADDTVILDPVSGARRPFGRPLRIHSRGLAELGLDPTDVPGSWFSDPYLWLPSAEDDPGDASPPDRLVFLERGDHEEVEGLSAATALARLLRGRMSEHGARDFRCLTGLATWATAHRLGYRDFERALDVLQGLAD